MTDSPIPDVAQTRLAFRTWGIDKATLTLTSTTPAGMSRKEREKLAHTHPLLAGLDDNIPGGWPKPEENDGLLHAACNAGGDHDGDAWQDAHRDRDGRVASPGADCNSGAGHGCGIYSTTDLEIVTRYLSNHNPIMGVVELGGRILDCEQGYRAEYASVAAIILLPKYLSSAGESLQRKVAAAYGVPVIESADFTDPEQYRALIHPEEAEAAAEASIADEAEDFLRNL